MAAFSIVARGSGGLAQLWRCGSSALAIEPWALRIACAVAVETNVPVVIFESDCKNLMSCINDPKVQVMWEIDGDIEEDLGDV
ncbi:hypothetical protein RHMOL_Rhmol07G0084000 [Rhododendron molle]|uniref:Uncharacterized protein n=1 Tax=Rhododendron molle TaxID=49168 RepID=A0ACC0MYR5_RHOML|nr:hypothetical protein RHMOL_Rhmol07G0084000 [Rhododendron molle]